MPEQHNAENKWPTANGPDPKLFEAIDACRPASDDISLSELRELAAELARDPRLAKVYARVQTLDAAIAEAVVDVPLPDGLHDRLLACVRAAQEAPAAALEIQGSGSTVVTAGPVSTGSVFTSRGLWGASRWPGGWLTACGGLALAASVALMVYLSLPAPQELDADRIVQLALEFHEKTHDAASPMAMPVADNGSRDKLLGQFPLSAAVTPGGRVQWHKVVDFLGRPGVAYEMAGPGGVRATLYAVNLAAPRTAPQLGPSLPTAPLGTPLLETGGRTVAAWREKGLLYVLVVDGELPAYRQFVAPPGRVASREASRPARFSENRATIRRDAIVSVSVAAFG